MYLIGVKIDFLVYTRNATAIAEKAQKNIFLNFSMKIKDTFGIVPVKPVFNPSCIDDSLIESGVFSLWRCRELRFLLIEIKHDLYLELEARFRLEIFKIYINLFRPRKFRSVNTSLSNQIRWSVMMLHFWMFPFVTCNWAFFENV